MKFFIQLLIQRRVSSSTTTNYKSHVFQHQLKSFPSAMAQVTKKWLVQTKKKTQDEKRAYFLLMLAYT